MTQDSRHESGNVLGCEMFAFGWAHEERGTALLESISNLKKIS